MVLWPLGRDCDIIRQPWERRIRDIEDHSDTLSRNLTILATADLHYNIARSRRPTERLAAEVCRTEADALVLAGDTAAANPDALRACLRLFDGFAGLKLLVPGNHCLWCRPGEDSVTRYEDLLPTVATERGFVLLDHEPQILGRVGLVGSIGWYPVK